MVPVKKQLGYLFSSTTHVRNMTTKMTQLEGKRLDVQNHVNKNDMSNMEVPARVSDWLKEVENIKKDVQSISSTESGCFDIKMRYQVGRKAVKNTEVIDNLIKEWLEMRWSDAEKPLGKVNTFAPSVGDAQNDFKSREKIFNEALSLSSTKRC
ncbi:hypothetical protein L2E82_36475 [Cichorium intybus]|uniref:Uncharacterized protein n=1 Tax=Cichorium intybus TaxID=13427 RepID=A0ACB9BRZ5_CICIN|nr:hypothetical protein L2E82_36475 [Cichorium intybus]